MSNRAIDYYIKGLDFDTRREIFKRLDKVNPRRVEELLEKEENYISFRRRGYNDETIKRVLTQSTENFINVNNVMIDNERYPLFDTPEDTYKSAKEYVDLLEKKDPKELEKEFGCTWDEYVPKVYKR